jgi:hypothetical protein
MNKLFDGEIDSVRQDIDVLRKQQNKLDDEKREILNSLTMPPCYTINDRSLYNKFHVLLKEIMNVEFKMRGWQV